MAKKAFIVTIILLLSTPWLTAAASFQPTMSANGKICRYLSWDPVPNISTDVTRGKQERRRLNETPDWITRVDVGNDGIDEAAVLFSDGTMKILSLEMGNLRTVSNVHDMAPDSPPIPVSSLGSEHIGGLVGIDDRGDLVAVDAGSGRTKRLAGGFSPVTYPVAADLDGDGNLEIAAVSDEGRMTIVKGKMQVRSDSSTELLPDTRIDVADLDRDGTLDIVVLSSPTDVHKMARLGDDLEAAGLAVFGWDGKNLKLYDEFRLPEGQVFESLIPSVICEEKEDPVIILVVTEEGNGSWLQSFSYGKGRLRTGRRGPRTTYDQMIHLLGSAKLGGEDRISVVTAVLREDAEGDLELYHTDLARSRTILKSSVFSHTSGSRLVETALIADFNADGMLEILAPADGMSSLRIYSLKGAGLRDSEVYNGSRKITTNLCPGDFDGNGKADVIFGLEDGTLIVLEGE